MTAIDVITESEELLEDAFKHECNGRHDQAFANLTSVLTIITDLLNSERKKSHEQP